MPHTPSPVATRRTVAKFYAITCLTNLWFFTGSWLYFYRQFMNDGRIGVLDGLVFAIGLLAEVPSGALADILGRKRLLIAGLVLSAVGLLVQGFATGYFHILMGMLLFVIGIACTSGADDALMYDVLDASDQRDHWGAVIARKFQFTHIATIVSIFVGGWLYLVHFRLPFILCGVGMLIAGLVSLTLTEAPAAEIMPAFSLSALGRQTMDGFRHLLTRRMWTYALMALLVLGAGYAFDLGVMKPLMLDHFGMQATAQSIVNGAATALAIAALSSLGWLRKQLGETPGLIILALFMGAGFIVASLPLGYYGIAPFLAIFLVNTLVQPWLNDVVQQHASAKHRATALSALALLQKVPYIVLAPVAGLASSGHSLPKFFIAMGAMMLLVTSALGIYKASRRSRKQQSVFNSEL